MAPEYLRGFLFAGKQEHIPVAQLFNPCGELNSCPELNLLVTDALIRDLLGIRLGLQYQQAKS